MRTGKHTIAEKEKHVSGRAIFFFLGMVTTKQKIYSVLLSGT